MTSKTSRGKKITSGKSSRIVIVLDEGSGIEAGVCTVQDDNPFRRSLSHSRASTGHAAGGANTLRCISSLTHHLVASLGPDRLLR